MVTKVTQRQKLHTETSSIGAYHEEKRNVIEVYRSRNVVNQKKQSKYLNPEGNTKSVVAEEIKKAKNGVWNFKTVSIFG